MALYTKMFIIIQNQINTELISGYYTVTYVRKRINYIISEGQ